mmetsp:Transcript_18906/g.38015  ORF Transcript_18906/g.38015 Transcript_18906/m.38015 type:complete len:556 (-) Transcript_18906:522-2189(-)
MEMRILTLVSLMNGFLHSTNFVNFCDESEDEEEKDRQQDFSVLFCQALGVVAPRCRVRKLVYKLKDIDGNYLPGVLTFLQEIRFLEEISVDGDANGSQGSVQKLADILEALAMNTFIKLRTIRLNSFYGKVHDQGDKIYNALRRLQSLQSLDLRCVQDSVANVIYFALICHSNIETVSVHDENRAVGCTETLIAMLASLPKLKHFEGSPRTNTFFQNLSYAANKLTSLTLTGEKTGVDVWASLLHNTRDLKNLSIVSGSVSAREFRTAFSGACSLENLKVHTIDDGTVLRCPQLRTLFCCEYEGELLTLLTQCHMLEDLHIDFRLSDSIACHLFRALQSNKSLVQLSVDFASTSEETKDQLRKMLFTNKTLKKLCILGTHNVMPIFVEALESNSCALEALRFGGYAEPLPLLRALRNNSTLSSISFYAILSDQVWNLLKDVIHDNVHLRKIHMCNRLFSPGIEVDTIAAILNQNFTLTETRLENFRHYQAQIDFVCDLFNRRNRVKHMLAHKELTAETWSRMLYTLGSNPSALYLALRYFPFPDRHGERKAHCEP